MTLLSEYNVQDLDDLKERVINPYIYGHSFNFSGTDLVLASVHQFRGGYESESPVDGSLEFEVSETREITRVVGLSRQMARCWGFKFLSIVNVNIARAKYRKKNFV